jgi:hypothetical protein
MPFVFRRMVRESHRIPSDSHSSRVPSSPPESTSVLERFLETANELSTTRGYCIVIGPSSGSAMADGPQARRSASEEPRVGTACSARRRDAEGNLKGVCGVAIRSSVHSRRNWPDPRGAGQRCGAVGCRRAARAAARGSPRPPALARRFRVMSRFGPCGTIPNDVRVRRDAPCARARSEGRRFLRMPKDRLASSPGHLERAAPIERRNISFRPRRIAELRNNRSSRACSAGSPSGPRRRM